MKRNLLKSIIFGVALHFVLALPVRADGFGNNNFQDAIENFGANNKSSAGINPGGNPNDDGQLPISADNTPIGSGLCILSSLGFVYGCFLFLRKKKSSN